MNISAKRATLLPALRRVTAVTGSQVSKEILQHVLITSAKGEESGLALAATDLELSMIVRTEAEVDEGGQIVPPAKDLLRIVDLAGDDITIRTMENRIMVETDNSVYWLSNLDSDLYPELPRITEAAKPVASEPFQRALEICLPAASTDESRPSMLMLHFDSDGVFSTDGSRAHFAKFESMLDGLNLPVGAVKTLIDLLKTSPSPHVFVDETQSHIVFLIGKTEFSTRVLESQFPTVRGSMIEPRRASHTVRLSIPRTRLELALRRAGAISDDNSGVVSLDLQGSDKCNVISTNSKGAKVVSVVDVDYTGAPRILHYAVPSLMDLTHIISDETLILRLSPIATEGSALVTSLDADAVVLPRVASSK